MYKNILKLACIPMVLSMFVLPTNAMAESKAHQNQMNPYHQSNLVNEYKIKKNKNYYYTPQDQQVAYLYALIAQLQAQLAILQANQPNSYPYTNGNYINTRDISRVLTGGVESNNNDAVIMDGKVTFARGTKARVWFEYGANTNLPYSTKSIKIEGASGNTKDFEIEATDLDNNKLYYYRAVAEDNNGNYVEGAIKSFRFDNRNNYERDDNDNDSNNDWSLDIDDDMFETGDTIRVDYELDDQDNDNWIGLYKVGDNDTRYISRIYIDDEEGYVNFRISNDGDYEFRVFDKDGDKQATSDEFEVKD